MYHEANHQPGIDSNSLQGDYEVVNLDRGGHTIVDNHLPSNGDTPVSAIVEVGNSGPGDTFQIVDLRNATIDGQGCKIFGDYSLDPTLDYLVIGDPCDINSGVGYKGVRKSDGEIQFGRFDPESMGPYDPRRRFKTSGDTSRSHFSVLSREDGLIIRDTNSLNGTRVYTPSKDAIDTAGHDSTLEANMARPAVDPSRLAQEIIAVPEQYDLSVELVTNPETAPVTTIEVDGLVFHFSPVLESGGHRKKAIGYAELPNGKVAPRLFYKSNSDGGWRAARLVWGDGNIDKGMHNYDGGYTQETKPADEVNELLSRMELVDGMHHKLEHTNIYGHFAPRSILDQEFDTYEQEVKPYTFQEMPQLYETSPGAGFSFQDGRSAAEHLAELELPDGFTPDFTSSPIRAFSREHTLLGETNIEVYSTNYNGRVYEWHVASDAAGRVWFDKIKDVTAVVTTYGTYDKIPLVGVLNNKPVEYRSQVDGLRKGDDFKDDFQGKYVDITPLLDNLPQVKSYREARGIKRV